MIRQATIGDAPRLAAIYNQSVSDRGFAADTKPVTGKDRERWLAEHVEPYPVFVFDSPSAGVIGWASLSPLSLRPTLKQVAEVAVFVDERYRRGLVGMKLFSHLIGAAHERGLRGLFGIAFAANTPVIRGSLAVGFQVVAEIPRAALSHGCQAGIVWMWKELRANDPPASAPMLLRTTLAKTLGKGGSEY